MSTQLSNDNHITLTWEQLKEIAPGIPDSRKGIEKYLNDTMAKEGINLTVNRVAMFISQALHESGLFNSFTENLNYRAEGLMDTWPTRFKTLAFAKKYERKPQKIANYVYANRYGNRSEETGDGWRYRGKGIFMVTFYDNHKDAGRYLKGDEKAFLGDNAERLATMENAVASAGWFWRSKNLCAFADADDIEGATKRINGGYIGLEHRKELYEKAKQVLS